MCVLISTQQFLVFARKIILHVVKRGTGKLIGRIMNFRYTITILGMPSPHCIMYVWISMKVSHTHERVRELKATD